MNDLATLNKCVDLLMTKLVAAQEELRRREQSCGTYHDVKKMAKLRVEIPSLMKRLARAERLQDAALAGTDAATEQANDAIATDYHAPVGQWSAVRLDYEEEGPVGWGATEAEAVEDLKFQIEESKP